MRSYEKRTAEVNGKKVLVSLYYVFKTSYGLQFSLKDIKDISIEDEYDRIVARCHVANCGFVISHKDTIIDNEYDLDEIYRMIENGECVCEGLKSAVK